MAYKDLSLKERHAIIRESVSRGIHRLSDIEAMYDASHAIPEQQIVVAPIEATPQEADVNTQPNLLAEGGGIHIKPSKRGTFTAAATKHGKSVQAFASQVLAHKENYSPTMVKKANFARNASHWHAEGGTLGHQYGLGSFLSSLFGGKKHEKEPKPITYQRVHPNDSPTREASEAKEDRMNERLSIHDRTYDYKWDIPYLDEKEIKIAGNRVSSNALDSLAKYAEKTGVPIEEAVGLAMYETHLGAVPFINYADYPKNATAQDSARVNASNRALGNASFFRNYGYIPAWALIRDNEYIQEGYSETKTQKQAGMSPLEHGLLMYKNGKYNRGLGEGVHTKNVKSKADVIKNDPAYKQWLNARGTKKSTGGPLYPFSFSKQPLPPVRY